MRGLVIEPIGTPASQTAEELRFGTKGDLWIARITGLLPPTAEDS
jgi:hypothetical protein